jgi:hypothetical protein
MERIKKRIKKGISKAGAARSGRGRDQSGSQKARSNKKGNQVVKTDAGKVITNQKGDKTVTRFKGKDGTTARSVRKKTKGGAVRTRQTVKGADGNKSTTSTRTKTNKRGNTTTKIKRDGVSARRKAPASPGRMAEGKGRSGGARKAMGKAGKAMRGAAERFGKRKEG